MLFSLPHALSTTKTVRSARSVPLGSAFSWASNVCVQVTARKIDPEKLELLQTALANSKNDLPKLTASPPSLEELFYSMSSNCLV